MPLTCEHPALLSRRIRTIACAVVLGVLFVGAQAAAAALAGRAVSDVLEELRGRGITFIYNTELVPDDLRIITEPTADEPVALARQVLAEHGLTVSQVAPQTFAVVRAPAESQSTSEERSAGSRAPAARVEEVVVETSRYTVASDIAGLHAFLDQQQVANLPKLGDETLQAVQRLPGVAVNGFSSVGPVRGGVSNETAIILDGLRLYEPFHLKNYLSPVSLLDSRMIAGLDVFFGGFPVYFGDRMSAIIDAHSVRPDARRYYELGLSLFHTNALAYGTFARERADVLLSARRSNLGELSQLAENDIGRPDYSDGFARLNYTVNDATRVAFTTLLSHDRISAVRASGTERARDESSNAYVWGTLDHDWSSTLHSRVIASYTQVSDERHGRVNDPGHRVGDVIDDRSFDIYGVRIENDWMMGRLTHRFGAEVFRLSADYDYAADVHIEAGFPFIGFPARETVRNVVLHPEGFESAAYWDAKFDLNARWAFEGGVRVDNQTYDDSGDGAQWSPRLSVLYNVSPATRLRASWGRFYQSQGINELQVEDGVDRFYPAQHANHSILSLEHAFPQQLDVRLELYRKDYRTLNPRFENLFDPLVLLPELQFDRVQIAPQSARTDGAELWLNWHPDGPWSGWFSYTWSQAQDRIDGEDVNRSWDQRHAITMGLAWRKGRWAATLVDSFHTGWPTTRIFLAPAGEAVPIVIGPRNTARYDDFNSLDVRLTHTFTLSRGELDLFFEVTNLAGRANPCCTQPRLVEDQQGNRTLEVRTDHWLPLVPSLGVLWRWKQ